MAAPLALHQASPAEIKERLEAERAGVPFVVVRDGAGAQRIVVLSPERGRATVGRHQDCDLCVDWDGGVSRVHAILDFVGGAWAVSDDGLSRNGTFVGESRVEGRRRLLSGDIVRVGNTVFAFCDPQVKGVETTLADDLSKAIKLSEAQKRVLVALCRPYRDAPDFAVPPTNREIAEELVLSVDAIKTHMRSLFHIFDVDEVPQNQKRVQLVERALNTGVITVRDLGAG
jgi:pSer/pThr/pTyr-binding forkhead associated (FHA) protein